METRLRKRKEQSLPTNPYARVFTKRRNFTNLRARRVFSPASVSDVKGSVEGNEKAGVVKEEETGGKVGFLDLGSGQEGRRESGEDELIRTTPSDGESKPNVEETEIVGKIGFLDLGECEKEEVLDLGFAIKDGEKGEEDELIQTTPLDSQIGSELKQNVKGDEKEEERILQKDGFVGEGEREEQPKPKVKTGFHSRSRSRLYKNPSSFSYKRLLPFLMDLTKDDSDAPVIYPIKKVDTFEEERLSPLLSVSQDILIDGVNKEVLPNKHPLGVLNASSNIPSNIKDSHSKSPEGSFIESTTTPKTPSTTALPTLNYSVTEKQVHLYGETASKTPEDIASVNSSCSLANLESSSMNEGDGLDKVCQRNNGNAKTESYNDESLQLTPPDSDVFCKPVPGKSKDCALDSSLKNRSVYDKNKCADESEKDNTKAKLGVLVPCSRQKLYRTPGSFSYRRLLPYLTNLAKNDTYTMGTSSCQNVDKACFEGRGSSLFDSQEVLKDGVDKGVPATGHCFAGSVASNLESTETTSPIGASNVDLPELNSTLDWPAAVVSQDPIVKSVIQEPHVNTIVSEVCCSTITKPSHADVESVSQVQQDMPDKVDNTELAHQGTLTVRETNVPVKSSAFPVMTTQSSLIPKIVDNGSFLMLKSSADAKSPMELSLKQESPNKLPLVLSEISPSGSSTGILKRHPRGCRGICNCLNCASYRLHAERAFEFSKNQMQDTEEVTMELVRELSDIRTLLEKCTNGAEPHSVQVPQLQAKEVCTKALRAEENAKYYLKQMNEELNIHCQTPCLQRPRVRFANNFEAQFPYQA